MVSKFILRSKKQAEISTFSPEAHYTDLTVLLVLDKIYAELTSSGTQLPVLDESGFELRFLNTI